MLRFRPALILGLTVAVALIAPVADSAHSANPRALLNKARKKSAMHTHHGVVESVGQKGNVGSLTIHTHQHKKKKGAKAGGGGGKNETFTITNSTIVTKHGKPTKLADLHKGEHVVVHASHHVAHKVEVVQHKHKKKMAKKKKV